MAPKQTADEEDFTELVDADFPRVDLVGKGANGAPGFLVMKQDATAGLLDPEFIQSLIAKEAEPVTGSQDNVTMTGSPASIGALMREIHGAPVRKGDDVAKAEMSGKAINDLPDSAFAYIEPGGEKDESGKTTPRSLRHFPVHDEAHARNALSRAPQSPFGDKAMPKIKAAAKKFGIDVAKAMADAGIPEDVIKAAMDAPDTDQGVDGLDPTVPLAAPDGNAPGDPLDPGSPAWEAIDAATAQKWLTILSRARVAIDLLAEREMVEAVTADPDDADNAFGLQDACCAIDYAISVLAPFAVAEQCEVDTGTMAAVTKAMAGIEAGGPLGLVEEFAAVAKVCNTLPAATRPKAQAAVTALVGVLKSLPPAPPTPSTDSGQPVAKQEGTAMAGTDDTTIPTEEVVAKAAAEAAPATPEAQAGDTGPVDAGGTTDAGALDARDAPPQEPPGRVTKASDDALCAVYDASGKLIGVADPSAITPVQGGAAEEPPPAAHEEPAMHDAPGHEQPADLAAKPAADTGTPADEVNKEAAAAAADSPAEATEPGDVAKAADPTETTPEDTTPAGDGNAAVSKGADAPPTTSDDNQVITVTKGTLRQIIAEQVGAALTTAGQAEAAVAKQADDGEDLAQVVKALAADVAALRAEPAMPRVVTNGAMPPAHMMRGQDRAPDGGQPVNVAKARDLKGQLVHGTPAEQTEAYREMQTMAIDALAGIHGTRR